MLKIRGPALRRRHGSPVGTRVPIPEGGEKLTILEGGRGRRAGWRGGGGGGSLHAGTRVAHVTTSGPRHRAKVYTGDVAGRAHATSGHFITPPTADADIDVEESGSPRSTGSPSGKPSTLLLTATTGSSTGRRPPPRCHQRDAAEARRATSAADREAFIRAARRGGWPTGRPTRRPSARYEQAAPPDQICGSGWSATGGNAASARRRRRLAMTIAEGSRADRGGRADSGLGSRPWAVSFLKRRPQPVPTGRFASTLFAGIPGVLSLDQGLRDRRPDPQHRTGDSFWAGHRRSRRSYTGDCLFFF